MSTIEIRVTQAVTVENFIASVAKGDVQFYRVRGNGTTRHIPVFAEGTEDFEKAEQVAEWREDGRTMKSIAAELHMSVPSVRRLLNSFHLSDEVAGYEPEDIEEILADAKTTGEDNEEIERGALVQGDPAAFVVGEVVAPADDTSHTGPRCSQCEDGLASGNICAECAAKPFQS